MNFISVDFHLHYLANYTLYVQSDFINNHLVVVSEDNEVLAYFRYDSLQPNSEVIKFLSYPFSNVIIGLPHQGLVWVPQEVFTPSDKILFTPYFIDENPDLILFKEVDSLDVVGLYQLDQVILHRWQKVFPTAKFVPNFEILIDQVKSQSNTEGEVLGVHIYDNKADLLLFINGEFKLYNTFEVATADDLSYFVISVLKNFGISWKIGKILLSGASQDSEWGTRLVNYCDEILVLESKTNWSVSNEEVKQELKMLNLLPDTGLCE